MQAITPFGHSPVTAERGYLPLTDPLTRLPHEFDAWEGVAGDLPKLLVAHRVRDAIHALPPFPLDAIRDERHLRRAMMILSFLGHAYVWGGERPATVIPSILAKPWAAVAALSGRPPVLSYASYAIDNWRRIDPNGPIDADNVVLLQNFLGGLDEEWFVIIHVDIERRAGGALAALEPAQQAVHDGDEAQLRRHLATVAESLQAIVNTMRRMPERCDPYVYYHRVRPFIHGWKNHPDVPEGVVYEGVWDEPKRFRGETGAQSAIVPALDAVLGVYHEEDMLKTYLLEMREYLPPDHRRFIESLEHGPSVREFVKTASAETQMEYDRCVALLDEFRSIHLEYAARYIHHQAQTDAKNPHEVGTGGTPFMKYLRKHRDETREHRIGD